MGEPLRIVFMGSDPIALPLLRWLTEEASAAARVVGVFTQPDRPTGRGQKVVANEIKTWALGRELPVFQPEKLTEESRAQLAQLNADLAVVMAYGHILKDAFISTPRAGSLNLHASLLPRFRGASPIQTAVACGARETGVALMRIVRKLDAGPVADVEKVSIEPLDTALDVEKKLAGACVPLLTRNLAKLREGALEFVEQDEGKATFCRKLRKEDGVLDFHGSAAELAARINGLYPWPGCTVSVGGESLKLGLAEVVEGGGGATPGQVLQTSQELTIATGADVLRVLRLQRAGARMLPAADFLRGFPIAEGTVLPSAPMAVLETTSPVKS